MRTYLQLMRRILRDGIDRPSRPGIVTRSLFGEQLRFDLSKGFPLVTTRRIHFKSVVVELQWMLRGDTNVKWLNERGVTIWDEWADKDGDLGPVYGKQWTKWQGVDGVDINQIQQVINSLRRDPNGRRHMVTAWNPSDITDMALPPCHCLFQFYLAHDKLSCHLYQRSADYFLGVPYNIASYALLTALIARTINAEVGDLIISFGDVHIYHNHFDAVRLQLKRTPRDLPYVKTTTIWGDSLLLPPECIELHNYNPHPNIPAPIAV